MLRIPQSPSSSETETVTIPMRDDSAADIDFILSCIYPTTRKLPVLDSLDRIESVLRIAEKWDFPRVFAIVSTNLLDLLRDGRDALHIWTIATHHELDVVRVAAADRLISGNIPVIPAAGDEPLPSLKSVDAFEYASLLFQHAAANDIPPVPMDLGTPRSHVSEPHTPGMVIGTPAPPSPSNESTHAQLIDPINISLPEVSPKMTFADGDLILRSSDGQDFCVHGLIVARASEWFSTRIKSRDASQDLQVIYVPEDATRIDWVLESIYPTTDLPTLCTIEEVTLMLEVAARLRVPRTASILAANLMEMLPTVDPLSIWVLGTGFRQARLRITAIKQILRENSKIIRTSGQPPAILRKVTGHDLASLLAMCASLRSQAEVILHSSDNLSSCPYGHYGEQGFTTAFIATSLDFGVFNDQAFSAYIAKQAVANRNGHCPGCSNMQFWERNEMEYSARRIAIQKLLDTIS